mgnify:CR=1 FL=1
MKNVNILKENGVNVDKSLDLFGDMGMYDATLIDFLEGVNDKLENLKHCKETADMVNYAVYVHSLKSDARYLGFEKLQDLAYQQEMKSKANDIMFIYDHYDELIEETNRIIKLVNDYLGNEKEKVEKPDFIVKDKAILVVDDSDMISKFIKKVFNNDYEVYTASDGAEAIEFLENNMNNTKIKAALIDLNMPNVNGFELLDYFIKNQLFVKIPVSIITGVDDKETIEKAFQYGIVDLLTKPFNERDIKRIVEKTINYNI